LTALRPRIGVFGGAFDPPHNAHVALARAALAQLGLTGLMVFPTGQAWHKDRGLSPAADRLAMTRLAFDGMPGVQVDARELARPGATFTVDTLTELQAEHPGAEFVLIIGADQATAFTGWHRWQEILEFATIAVAQRDHSTLGNGSFLPENPLATLPGARSRLLVLPPMDISATAIRALCTGGHGIDHLVPADVARYIENHHLYLPDR
jgi:nicotinate-nucleotide adenylyltransferase